MRLKFAVLALVLCIYTALGFGQTSAIVWSNSPCTGCGRATSLASSSPAKTIEPLTFIEKAALVDARKALVDAQENLRLIEQAVKLLHGEKHSLCDNSGTTVTFFGDYALVYTEPASGCASSGTFQVNAVPYNTYPLVNPIGTAAPGGNITIQ